MHNKNIQNDRNGFSPKCYSSHAVDWKLSAPTGHVLLGLHILNRILTSPRSSYGTHVDHVVHGNQRSSSAASAHGSHGEDSTFVLCGSGMDIRVKVITTVTLLRLLPATEWISGHRVIPF